MAAKKLDAEDFELTFDNWNVSKIQVILIDNSLQMKRCLVFVFLIKFAYEVGEIATEQVAANDLTKRGCIEDFLFLCREKSFCFVNNKRQYLMFVSLSFATRSTGKIKERRINRVSLLRQACRRAETMQVVNKC